MVNEPSTTSNKTKPIQSERTNPLARSSKEKQVPSLESMLNLSNDCVVAGERTNDKPPTNALVILPDCNACNASESAVREEEQAVSAQ